MLGPLLPLLIDLIDLLMEPVAQIRGDVYNDLATIAGESVFDFCQRGIGINVIPETFHFFIAE